MTIGYTCANCNREMTCLKNDVALIHFMNNDKKLGIDELRFGDLYGCKICGANIVTGLAGVSILGLDIQNQEVLLQKLEKNHALIEVKR